MEKVVSSLERVLDFFTVAGAVSSSYFLYSIFTAGTRAHYSAMELLFASSAYAFVFTMLLDRHGEYRPYLSLLSVRESERLLRVTLQTLVCTSLAAYCLATPISRLVLLIATLIVPTILTLQKRGTHQAIRVLRNKGYGTRKAAVLGTGSYGRQVYSVLHRSPKFGLDPIGFLSDDPDEWGREIFECSYQRKLPTFVLPGRPSPELLHELGASVLVVALQGLSQDTILDMAAQFSAQNISVYFAPAEFLECGHHIEYTEVDGIILGHASAESTRPVYEAGKRLLDLGLSVLLLLCLSPLFAVVALLVKLTTPGPVIFRQDRVGRNGRIFPMLKFRSMFVDAPQFAFSPTTGEDPRITPVGRFLRRTSLDELPQIVNVLLGQMSLVGPRPEMSFIAEQYSPRLRERLNVKPGMTGLWQLSADRAFLIHDNIEYDLYYVRHRSLFLDVAILLHTVLFAGRGV